ncbi:hypothetical protein F4782DRAFT_527350 [Xylaria castorea]|nr:hypothetical protein F4782DRAFT_527350 [Xylaria castorea]
MWWRIPSTEGSKNNLYSNILVNLDDHDYDHDSVSAVIDPRKSWIHYDAYLDQVPLDEVTIEGCLRSFGSTAPLIDQLEPHLYAGLRNQSKWICGVQLSTNALKLQVDDCIRPCSGDSRLSCGGQNNVAVCAAFQPAETLHHSGAPVKPVLTPTIAAITGSLSGAIIIAVGLFLCHWVHRRKGRLRDTHVKSVLERRGRRFVPNLILTRANIPSSVTDLAINEYKRNNDRNSSSSGTHDHTGEFHATADGDLVTSTPVLESRTNTIGASSAVQW